MEVPREGRSWLSQRNLHKNAELHGFFFLLSAKMAARCIFFFLSLLLHRLAYVGFSKCIKKREGSISDNEMHKERAVPTRSNGRYFVLVSKQTFQRRLAKEKTIRPIVLVAPLTKHKK